MAGASTTARPPRGQAADIRERLAQGASFCGADLAGIDLCGADLSKAQLFKANLAGANLSGANLTGAELTGANLVGANLSEAHLENAGLGSADLTGASFLNANLTHATLSQATAHRADFRCAVLVDARLRETRLDGADLTGAVMTAVDLTSAEVSGAVFDGVDLRGAHLHTVRGYRQASWLGVDLRDVNFSGAYDLRRFVIDENYLHEFKTRNRWCGIVHFVWSLTSDCGRSLTLWCAWIAAVTLVYSVAYTFVDLDYGLHRTWLSPLYYSVVTMSTLGYGDVMPASMVGQIVAMLQVMTGYAMLGVLLTLLNNKVARRGE